MRQILSSHKVGEGEHNGPHPVDDGSNTHPDGLVTPPTKIADRDNAENNSDVEGASNESRHCAGELVATLNG